MRLSSSTNKKFGQGQIVNFVQVDAQQLMWVCFGMADASQVPIVLVFSFVMLFWYLGLSFFSGLGVFFVAFLVNLVMGGCVQKKQKSFMDSKDKRMNATTEALNNVKMLKQYAWTDVFLEEVNLRRRTEIRNLGKLAVVMSFVLSSLYFFPSVLSSVVFSTYIGFGNYIDLKDAFTVMVFFGLVKGPLQSLPMFVNQMIQLVVSMNRIQEFIDSDEVDRDKIVSLNESTNIPGAPAILIQNHSFSWGIKAEDEEEEPGAKKKGKNKGKTSKRTDINRTEVEHQETSQSMSNVFETMGDIKQSLVSDDEKKSLSGLITLRQINLEVKSGELVVIIGDVGSGKSSLLQAIIGELLYVNP